MLSSHSDGNLLVNFRDEMSSEPFNERRLWDFSLIRRRQKLLEQGETGQCSSKLIPRANLRAETKRNLERKKQTFLRSINATKVAMQSQPIEIFCCAILIAFGVHLPQNYLLNRGGKKFTKIREWQDINDKTRLIARASPSAIIDRSFVANRIDFRNTSLVCMHRTLVQAFFVRVKFNRRVENHLNDFHLAFHRFALHFINIFKIYIFRQKIAKYTCTELFQLK